MTRRLIRWFPGTAGLVALALLLELAPSAGAAARGGHTHVSGLPAADTVQLGPLRARNGFQLYITDQDCGASDAALQLQYVKQSHGATLTHTFTGFSADCTIQSSGAARLSARVRGLLNLNVSVGGLGQALRSAGLPAGCGPPFGPEYPASAAGTIGVGVDSGSLGSINLSHANAQVFSGAPQTCPATQAATGRELTADIGAAVLDVNAPTRGAAQLDVVDPDVGQPAAGITDALGLQVSGAAAYRLTNANNSATLGAHAPFTSGSLSFAALPACSGTTAQNGTLSGTLTIHDPVLGAVAFIGASASLAYTGLGSAQPGGCNGPASEPIEPALLSTCSYAGSGCSASGGPVAVTLYDETDPGTQSIASESINFGDGSAPASISNYGTAVHSYSQSGAYTVTLTVTSTTGTTSTGTTEVYIDP